MIEYHNKITAQYSHLSVGDEDSDGGESNSIVNQKAFLERYAKNATVEERNRRSKERKITSLS